MGWRRAGLVLMEQRLAGQILAADAGQQASPNGTRQDVSAGRQAKRCESEAWSDLACWSLTNRTALMMATSVNILDLLLSAGAEINARDRLGATALTFARSRDNSAAVQLLTSKGATGPILEQPRLIKRIEPRYTRKAISAKVQGQVPLNVVIDTDGRAADIRVVKSLGFGLDEAAVKAVQNWKFKPGTLDGKPMKLQETIEVNFRLR
jgi:TonB family protein